MSKPELETIAQSDVGSVEAVIETSNTERPPAPVLPVFERPATKSLQEVPVRTLSAPPTFTFYRSPAHSARPGEFVVHMMGALAPSGQGAVLLDGYADEHLSSEVVELLEQLESAIAAAAGFNKV